MSPINLSQSYRSTAGAAKKSSIADKGVLIAVVIFIITLLIFGGLFLYTKVLAGRAESVSKEIEAETLNLAAKDADRVADFQKRLENIDENISSEKNPNDILKRLAQSMVSGAVIISLQTARSGSSITFQADNFQTAAKQILSFKKGGNFNNVAVTGINREQDGKIAISVEISL